MSIEEHNSATLPRQPKDSTLIHITDTGKHAMWSEVRHQWIIIDYKYLEEQILNNMIAGA